MKAIASQSPTDLVVEDYQEHLIDVAGLQPSTCQKWTLFVRLFLNAQFEPKAPRLPLRQLEPEVLLDFVLQQGKHYPPGQLQSLASALRSFCRFLCVTGRHPRDLSAALPSISGHHRAELPIYLSRTQLQQLLETFDRRTLLGKRDDAMVLCLARLGLRAGELARLSLEDLDWRNGWLRLAAPQGPTRAASAAARGSGPGLGSLSAKRPSQGGNPAALPHRLRPTSDEFCLAL
jgi:integrase/recombinase XerD